MKRYVIIVAGGQGLRMGGSMPKQFRLINRRPVLIHTIEAFIKAYPDIGIVLVLPRNHIEMWKELWRSFDLHVPIQIAEGGASRFESVSNGLALIPDDEEAIVGVHDGVRPFVSSDLIHRCYERAECGCAAIPMIPVVDSIRHLQPDGVSTTLNRKEYFFVQTPQTFPLAMLRAAYAQPYDPTFTDDASVVEHMGERIHLVIGESRNFKLTTPEDLILANALCKT